MRGNNSNTLSIRDVMEGLLLLFLLVFIAADKEPILVGMEQTFQDITTEGATTEDTKTLVGGTDI